ncbi:hypothetical protein ACKVC7_00950 (plasmid) [Escherichia coli]
MKTHSEADPEVHRPGEKVEDLLCQMVSVRGERGEGVGEPRQRPGSGQSSVVSYFLNITAFCKDDDETALEVEQDILNSFRKNGFELISPRFNHMRNFLTCLPFMGRERAV